MLIARLRLLVIDPEYLLSEITAVKGLETAIAALDDGFAYPVLQKTDSQLL